MLRESQFPNVMVDCPECDMGDTEVPGRSTSTKDCKVCNGTGKVPSAEEWAIHDYDDFGGLTFGENPSLERIAEIAEALEGHGQAYIAYLKYQDEDYASVKDFEENYRGCYSTEEDFAEELMEETWGFSQEAWDYVSRYIDFEKYARDLKTSGDAHFEDYDGDVYVFWSS